MKKLFTLRNALIIVIPVLLAFTMRAFFGVDDWSSLYMVMTVAFIFLVPAAVGALTIFLSPVEQVKRFSYRFFVPWIPVLCFMALTILLSIEGWACWIMILPVFMIAASVGGMIAGKLKLKRKGEKLYVSCVIFLPFIISPIEQSIAKLPAQYKAYTSIDIDASKEIIWRNVTRVNTISIKEDRGWLTHALGFPRPVKAELNYEGIGAFRKAIFDRGLVFDETVSAYEHQKKMTFTIKANPYDIPSTTMDRHIVVGGDYFDVLDGTYELEHLETNLYRLHLYSHFKLNTTFNFYASWWAGWIMKDIQKNILMVIKERAEERVINVQSAYRQR